MLSPDIKAMILQAKPQNAPNCPPIPKPGTFPLPRRNINEHELTALIAALHDVHGGSQTDFTEEDGAISQHEESDDNDQPLLAHITKRKPLSPGNIKQLLSNAANNKTNAKPKADIDSPKEININGAVYRQVNTVCITYNVLASSIKQWGALIDRGANGGIAGEDVRVIATTGHQVDIQGIDNHCINNIPIVTAGGVINTQKGEVIAIMHQYAYVGKGKTIHSCGQLDAYKLTVHDKSIKIGGLQRIETPDGYIIPLNVRNGLIYMSIRPYTDNEWETLPQVILTADVD